MAEFYRIFQETRFGSWSFRMGAEFVGVSLSGYGVTSRLFCFYRLPGSCWFCSQTQHIIGVHKKNCHLFMSSVAAKAFVYILFAYIMLSLVGIYGLCPCPCLTILLFYPILVFLVLYLIVTVFALLNDLLISRDLRLIPPPSSRLEPVHCLGKW